MRKLFGVAFLALPILAGSAHAAGWPFNVQAGGHWYIKGGPGPAWPQAGPWYLYWPLEKHFVAPAPTGYPYWPNPQVLPATVFGGPTHPPGKPVVPHAVAVAPALPPAISTRPQTAPQTAPRAAPQTAPRPAPRTTPQGMFPPYLQPTAYSPINITGEAPSYWYDR